ncbi:hypothetical protein EV179_002143 [Coemansia sp. RSA 487]|nr:hypothetical protein LPJ74_005226 [Coemansia sp. RSA 1843]KAJ2090364.1 hypothetical protein IW138_002790 [Coemansia sp. RSA 986]KAJ2215550.1 hypothetical protein EV179_002143 [Coemansia sp. RSA 487]
MHTKHAETIQISLAQVPDRAANSVSSAVPVPRLTQPIWLSQDVNNAYVHIAPMPTSFSLQVALESPYVFDIVGAKVSLKPTISPAVSSVLRMDKDLEPLHPQQTAPPPAIFQTQVPASVAKSTKPPDSDVSHGHIHTKTETVVVVGSQIPQNEAIGKSTIPSPPPVNNQQGLASVLSRSGIQLRISNAQSLINAAPTYAHAITPAPTLNYHKESAYASESISTSSTTHKMSASFPVYSINPSEKRITNGNGNNLQGNKPYKLADGFICLIIIGLVFALAMPFYLFMRHRRKQKLRSARGSNGSDSSSSNLTRGAAVSSGPSSKQSLSSNEDSYQHRQPGVGEKHQRYVPDSGTDIANRHNKPANNAQKAFRNSNSAAITMYLLQTSQNNPASHNKHTEHKRIIHIDEQDRYATEKMDQSYIEYRTKSMKAKCAGRGSSGTANVEKQAHMRPPIPPGFAKAYTKEPDANNGTRRIEPRNESEGSSANKCIYALREPARVVLPSSEHHRHGITNLESKAPETRLYMSDRNKEGAARYSRERGAANKNEPTLVASSNTKQRNMLLDTSSVNPGMSAPKSDSPQGLQQKPRKLVRGSTKRERASSPAKDTKNVGRKSSRSTDHNSSLSLRAMFRNQPPLHQKDGQKGKSSRQKEQFQDANSSDSGNDRQEAENKRKSEQLLTDSIESISDNYQLAVRHKPPLGPLRTVEPHVPVLPDELVVERGDRMYVFGEFADGWVLAMNVSRGSDLGMVPRRCLFFPTAPFMTEDAITASCASPNSERPRAGVDC